MPSLSTDRILLRPYRSEDYNAISAWANDSGTTRYLSTRFWSPQSDNDVMEYLNERMQAAPGRFCFVIAEKATERYLGQIDLMQVDWRLRAASLGLVLLPACRGQGYALEALGLLREFVFGTLGLERLELEVHEDNAPALRCYEKAGFRREGVKRHAYFSDGRFRDLILMSILREEHERMTAGEAGGTHGSRA